MVLHDFIVEDGEVECEAKLDGVARRKRDLVSFIVGFKGFGLNLFELITLGVFSNVAVVVTDHLDEESPCLVCAIFFENL